MQVAYIGTKEIKADNVAQTGFIWKRGEVHEVADEKKALKLIEHSLVWANVTGKSPEQIAAMLLPELKAVPPEPRVSFIPQDPATPYWEPVVVVVPEEIFNKMQSKELVAVFMSPEDADAFGEWKLERDTRPGVDTSPKKTGPKMQARETKQGLDAAKKVA